MGCGKSKGTATPEKAAADKAAKAKVEAARAANAERRKHLKPEDFIISRRTGEAIVKEEGTICGEQFNIEECKDCDIFLLDHLACAFIDDCMNCRIFVGPVESSVMLRNCSSCDVVIACQQFRSRDCSDCKFALLCTTEPIIETSTNMRFACFEFGYFSLRRQLERADLKLWNNKWSQIYDFNKNPERPNWSLLPQEEAPRLLRIEASGGAVSPEELAMDPVVPVTLGGRPWPSEERCFVLFMPRNEAAVEAFLGRAGKAEGWAIGRTRSTVLGEDRLKALFAWAKEPKLVNSCINQELTGVELCGAGIFRQVHEALAAMDLGPRAARAVPQQETPALSKAFFEVWKDEV